MLGFSPLTCVAIVYGALELAENMNTLLLVGELVDIALPPGNNCLQ